MGSVSLGAWSTVGNPQVAEAMLSTGVYDWLAVDLEHCAFTEDQIGAIFMVCLKYKVKPFARISGHFPVEGRKMLDLGAEGLIVPVVQTAQQFSELSKHFFYPPKGVRGVCRYRINKWGDNFDEYIRDFKPVLIPQLETKMSVENADAIAALPEVDAIFLGPYDLSASLGTPGNFKTPAFAEAIQTMKAAAKRHNKGLAIHVVDPDPSDLNRRIEEGFDVIAYGTDMICLRSSLKGLKQKELR